VSNPEVAQASLTDTASLVVSEPGKYRIQVTAGASTGVYLGASNVDPANAATIGWALNSSVSVLELTFDADVELYARSSTGNTATLRITRWF
jgi:hypothetical protein